MSNRPKAGFLIAVGVILVISALVYWGFNDVIAGSDTLKLPKSLAKLPLNTVTYGPDAVNEITRLHGKKFAIITGAMGMYGNDNQATLWVADFATVSTADQAIDAMREKIASTDSPFTPTDQKQVDGRTLYQLDGMGQKHIYFQSDSKVIWLAVNSVIAEQSFQQILRFFP